MHNEMTGSAATLGHSVRPAEEVGIVHVGLDGRFLRSNLKFSQITGYSAAELQGLTFQEITHPDDCEADVELARRLAEGEIPAYTMEKRYIRKGGDTVWIRLTGSIVRDTQDAPLYFIAVIEDIESRKLAEAQALRWQRLFASAEFGLAQIDIESNTFIEVNPTFARQRGYAPAEMQGLRILDIYPPDRHEEARAKIQAIDKAGHAVFESVHLRKDGSSFPVLVEVTVIKDGEGRPVCRISNCQDITERKKAEGELQRIHEEVARHLAQLETVLDSMTGGLVVADLDGKVYHWNRAALEMHGFASLDECRRDLQDFRGIFEFSGLDGQAVPFENWPIMRILRGEQLKNWEVMLRRIGTDWQRIFAYSGTLARDTNGEPLLAILNIDDITERKRSEEALQRYRLIADNSRDIMLFIRRSDGKIVDANVAAVKAYGYTHEELLNLTILDLRAADTLEQAAIQLSIADDRGLLFETFHRRKDGTTFPVGVSSQGSTINGERMLISVIRDITQRKRYEQELLQAREEAEAASLAKSQFLASMSHEIRTPMTVFLGALEHLLQIDQNPQRRQLLTLADQAARRLHALIDDVLDFSRIEARRLEICAERFELRDSLQKIVGMMSTMAREKQLGLELEVAPAVPVHIVSDQYRLEQVLLNLLSNAIKFTERGRVEVSVQRVGGGLTFRVSDTGIGIPEDKFELIFHAFSQVDSSSTRRFGGTGLGLAISRQLVELLGGKLSVRSRQGAGSEFFFTIPLNAAADREQVPAAGAVRNPAGGHRQ